METETLREIAVPDLRPRYTRRLSDKLLLAFDQACDLQELAAAEQIFVTLEMLLSRRLSTDPERRHGNVVLETCWDRLQALKDAVLPPAAVRRQSRL
jgi:hypothetical protein